MNVTDLINDLRASINGIKAQSHDTVPVSGLEAYLAEMQRIAGIQEEPALEEKLREDARRKFEHDSDLWKTQAPLQHASRLEMFKSVVEAGQTALISAMAINGGAAVALLAFLGNLLTTQAEDVDPFPISGIGIALLVFLLGLGCAGLASGIRYLVQTAYSLRWKKSGIALNIVSIGLGLASFSAFFLGSVWAYLAIV